MICIPAKCLHRGGLVGDDPLDWPLSRSLLENDERIGAGVGGSTGSGTVASIEPKQPVRVD